MEGGRGALQSFMYVIDCSQFFVIVTWKFFGNCFVLFYNTFVCFGFFKCYFCFFGRGVKNMTFCFVFLLEATEIGQVEGENEVTVSTWLVYFNKLSIKAHFIYIISYSLHWRWLITIICKSKRSCFVLLSFYMLLILRTLYFLSIIIVIAWVIFKLNEAYYL